MEIQPEYQGTRTHDLSVHHAWTTILAIINLVRASPFYTSPICRKPVFAICDCDAHRGSQKSPAISETLHCDLGVRWKFASDLRFRVAISEAETPSFCGISGDLAQSTGGSLAIAIVRFWCAKLRRVSGAAGISSLLEMPTDFWHLSCTSDKPR